MKRLMMILLMAFVSLTTFAQDVQAPLELDKDVRVGKLDNGLTYYIRNNKKPENRASFYLVTNVGAIQETPAQDGLAHVLEHMCLNGTKNFPGKGIISYMESIGAKFGANINAGTGVEQTSYLLKNIPVTRQGIIDSSLLILHDYAYLVTNDPKEIEAERGVILEEWRTRRDARQRDMEAQIAALFKGSKYATCNIIGSKENLEIFKPEDLISFYKTWYRPDLQAVVVVGDLDVDYVEAKIKEYFNRIPKAENPQAKEEITIPDNDEPIVSIFTDKELNATSATVYFKSEPIPAHFKGAEFAVVDDIMKSLISSMLNERLDDISKKPNAPFLEAGNGFFSLYNPIDAYVISVATKDGDILNGFKSVMTEVERAKKYGFNQDEFDRAKANILKNLENAKNNADSRQNEQFCAAYIANFTKNEPYMTPEYKYDIYKKYLDIVPLAILNQAYPQVLTEKNVVITYSAPEKDGVSVPTESDFTNIIKAVKDEDIQPMESEVSNEPLMDPSVLKGSKIKKTESGMFGSTIYTLANGIKVIVKPTDYKKNEIIIQSVAEGGKSILPEELLPAVEDNMFAMYQQNSGLSKFTESQLTKMLTGKIASASYSIGEMFHGVSAYSSPIDLETAMQLLYLSYTDPRVEQDELQVGIDQVNAILPNLEKQPNFIFSKAIQKASAVSPRNVIVDENVVKNCNAERVKSVLDMLYKDAVGTKVFIIGNVNLDTLKPMIERYIGSIPVKSKKAFKPIDHDLYPAKEFVNNTFDVEMETPKTSIALMYSAYSVKNNLENSVIMSGLTGVLDQLYTKTIREDEGGTYGVKVGSEMSGGKVARDYAYLVISFDTEYEKSEKLIQLAKDGLKDIAENGPNAEYLAKTKENLLKNYPEKQIDNRYWTGVLRQYYLMDKDIHTTYEDVVNKVLTPENVQELAKKILASGFETDVIMNPKAK